jgi:feruloyl esterase
MIRSAALATAGLALVGCASLEAGPTASAAAAGPQAAATEAGPFRGGDCPALAASAFADASVRITSAALRPAGPAQTRGGPPAPAPEHCEVQGLMQERQGANGQKYAIKFHMRLPASAWNGRFFFAGGGGTNGVVGDAYGPLLGAQPGHALGLGYAVISTDSGHDNAVNVDRARGGTATFGWDAQARRNYGWAAIGPVAQAGRALIRAYYGRDPQFSYYVGGSKGGQEAMMAAQRFPELFDGVLAGYPGFRLADAGAVGQMWDAQAFAEAAKALGRDTFEGPPLINRAMSDDDLLLVSQAVLKACDDLDYAADGMVEAFALCTDERVVPALDAATCKDDDKTSACLAKAQVAALRKVFGGAKGKDGRQLYASWPWDAGIAARSKAGAVSQGWRDWKMGPYASAVNSGRAVTLGGVSASTIFTSPPTAVADEAAALTRYTLAVDAEANWAKAREKWGEFNEAAVDFMNADAVDLSAFSGRGGKMLVFHGVSDPVFSINDTIAWWNAVDAVERGRAPPTVEPQRGRRGRVAPAPPLAEAASASRFVRLFAVPGMNHGGGGPATEQFDAFGALVAWRERGVAPEKLVAAAGPNTPWPGRTRLLCPYPQQPRRTGMEMEKAESFGCFQPPAEQAAAR